MTNGRSNCKCSDRRLWWVIEQMGEKPAATYFPMEVGLDDAVPTYSGRVGILAGDWLHVAGRGGNRATRPS